MDKFSETDTNYSLVMAWNDTTRYEKQRKKISSNTKARWNANKNPRKIC